MPGKSGNLMHTSGPAVAFFRNRQTGTKAEELCSIFREIYTDYLKEKEPEKEDAVLAELVKDAGELRQKCIEKMPSYLKRGGG